MRRELVALMVTGRSLILDGCNHTKARRKLLLSCFEPGEYLVECHRLSTTYTAALHNSHNGKSYKDRPLNLVQFNKEFEEPCLAEGFANIRFIPFAYAVQKATMGQNRNKALFFDLDGTVRRSLGKHMWPKLVHDVEIYSDVDAQLRSYFDLGYLLIGVTNQSCIGKGLATEEEIQDCIIETIKRLKVPIEEVFYCPHHPDEGCGCRKPNPDMAFWARKKYFLDLSQSIMVGDAESDAKFVTNAGIGQFFYRGAFFGVKDDLN